MSKIKKVMHYSGSAASLGKRLRAEKYLEECTGKENDAEKDLADSAPLTSEIRRLSVAIDDLKRRYGKLANFNEELQAEIGSAKMRNADRARVRKDLENELEYARGEFDSAEDLKAEIERLNIDKDSMEQKVRDLTEALASSEHRVNEFMQLVERYRTELDDASEEAACINEQFSRAMEVIRILRSKIDSGETCITEIGEAVIDVSKKM